MLSIEIKQTIKGRYARIAGGIEGESQPLPASAPGRADLLAAARLYSDEELALVPQRARQLFQGCGNAADAALLRPGESVVDLGCGAGLDLILAAHRIGRQGRIFGADLAGPMVEQARRAVAEGGLPPENITLRETDIEGPCLPKSFADVLLANNVINLCPDKAAVFRNIFRVLRPGARLVIADIVAAGDIDEKSLHRLQAAWAVPGLMSEEGYRRMLKGLSFIDIWTVSRQPLGVDELEALTCGSASHQFGSLLERDDLAQLADKLAAVTWSATRPPLNC